MKIVIIGGNGLIGTKLGKLLGEAGHEVLAASPRSGVNTLTGEGLSGALQGAQTVVDVSNSPTFEDTAVLNFFETSTRNLLRADTAAGVRHQVILSIVGAERCPDSGYMRAKIAQETLLKNSTVPYTILRATQFFEFAGSIADSGYDGKTVRLPSALMQPVAAQDVAAALARVAQNAPVNGTVELAGPEKIGMDELARRWFSAKKDPRPVTTDPQARYFGELVNDRSLVPADKPQLLGAIRFADWLKQSVSP
jgi:uncharacterized protein YbjT (DUF2867 family)